jgi:UDP-N-acetylmuramoylalanine-D-glutamate ligase
VELAKKVTPRGSACILSPAAASYGIFKNFEERGDAFRDLVFEL